MSGLYVHIPFCHAKCAYCDFYSMPRADGYSEYVDAVTRELEMRADELSEPITTVYLGGGTPSMLDDDSIGRLIDAIRRYAHDISEFTIECNPEDVKGARVGRWRQMGVNRVSMGVQSLDDGLLALIGRRHTAQQAIDAVEQIRAGGIGNVNLDLMYGLPGQTMEAWLDTLNRLLDLRPDHLSAYILSYEPRTRLTAMLKTGKITQAPEDLVIEMYHALCRTARQRGYQHYEVSNFAVPGRCARHNSNYWLGVPYLGLGPGAHSFDGATRRYNPSNIKSYMAAMQAGMAYFEVDAEDEDNRFNDLVMTALRTSRGLDISSIEQSRARQLLKDAERYINSGDLILTDNILTIPEPSWLISDAIIADLMQ